MITWVNGLWLYEPETVARNGKVTSSLWLFLGDFTSFMGSSVFEVKVTIALKKRDYGKKVEYQGKNFHNHIRST